MCIGVFKKMTENATSYFVADENRALPLSHLIVTLCQIVFDPDVAVLF
jgi:hypothetical protein